MGTAVENFCPHCGNLAHEVGQCPRVRAVEYYKDGTLKRVEYHEPAALVVSAGVRPGSQLSMQEG